MVIVQNLTSMEVALFSHLVEILNFFVRQHLFRSKLFILANSLASRVGQLVACPEKHLKLSERPQRDFGRVGRGLTVMQRH